MMKNQFKTYSIWYIILFFLLLATALWAYYDTQISKIDQDIESIKKQS